VKTVELKTDPNLWAQIPLVFPCGPFETQSDWAAAFGDAYSENQPNARDTRIRLTEMAAALPIEMRPGLFKRLWMLPDPNNRPLIVFVGGMPEDGLEDVPIQDLAGAYDSEPVRPPVVDQFDSPVFGKFARVISYTKDRETDRLVMAITLVGRLDGMLVRLDAFTPDLAGGVLAVDAITELMDLISIGDTEDQAATE
jgi:hypothetical protein